MGVDQTPYVATRRTSHKGTLLFLGRITPHKHLDVVMQALRRMNDEGYQAKMDIYGLPHVTDEVYEKQLRLESSDLEQSGVLERHGLNLASLRAGIWGRVQDLQTPLRDRDRVEVYRELQCDPKEARRLRYRKKPAKTTSGRPKATSL